MRFLVLIFIATLMLALPAQAKFNCGKQLDLPSSEAAEAFVSCASPLCSSASLAQRISTTVQNSLKVSGEFIKAKKGYAIIVGGMIGSAALTTYVNGHVAKDAGFLTQLSVQFFASVSFLGSIAIGAPIMEPISSLARKLAFVMSPDTDKVTDNSRENERLEALWFKTQKNYSLNSQMSRNVINLFISSTRQNFYEAYRAIQSDNHDYAADQVAEAAIRMKTLFKDVPPNDQSVTTAVRLTFAKHITDRDFLKLVSQRIDIDDPDSKTTESREYYARLLKAWFNLESE